MVDENNVAQLEHFDNTCWQFFYDSMLKSQESFFKVYQECLLAGNILKAANLNGAAASMRIAFGKLATEAVRRGILPAQNIEGFDELKKIIKENS